MKAKYPNMTMKPGGPDFLMKKLNRGVGPNRFLFSFNCSFTFFFFFVEYLFLEKKSIKLLFHLFLNVKYLHRATLYGTGYVHLHTKEAAARSICPSALT